MPFLNNFFFHSSSKMFSVPLITEILSSLPPPLFLLIFFSLSSFGPHSTIRTQQQEDFHCREMFTRYALVQLLRLRVIFHSQPLLIYLLSFADSWQGHPDSAWRHNACLNSPFPHKRQTTTPRTRYEQCVGSLRSHRIYMCKGCETGPTVCRPYPRRLESLTVCGCLYKGSTFSSVI